MKIQFKPIGVIHSPFKKKEEIPCQGYKTNKIGNVEVFKEYEEALTGIEGFPHIIFDQKENVRIGWLKGKT